MVDYKQFFYVLLPTYWEHAIQYMILIINLFMKLSKPCNKIFYRFYNAKPLMY